jgi:hypothetical protein
MRAKPDKSFVRISDWIGSRDPKFSSCEYYISVHNKHNTWSLKDIAVDINGTIYDLKISIYSCKLTSNKEKKGVCDTDEKKRRVSRDVSGYFRVIKCTDFGNNIATLASE